MRKLILKTVALCAVLISLNNDVSGQLIPPIPKIYYAFNQTTSSNNLNRNPQPYILSNEVRNLIRSHQSHITTSVRNRLSLSTGGRKYFVSSNGNDNNDGLSLATAWKTTNPINAYQFNSDTLLLDGNISGTIEFGTDDVSTAIKPIVIRSLSSRATIEGIFIYNIAGIEVRNINIVGPGAETNSRDGILAFK